MTEQDRPRALRWALRCHPAAYRAEHEAELSAIYAEATQDAGPLGRLREALDVAGHGLRRRTGLGSDRTAGQILAEAAPLAVTLATGSFVTGLLLPAFAPGDKALSPPGLAKVLLFSDEGLVSLLWLAALAAVWTGRWSAARALVVPATVLHMLPVLLLPLTHFAPHGPGTTTSTALNLAASLVTGAIVLAAPRDLLGPARPQRGAIAGTAALAVLLTGAQLVNMYYPQQLGGPSTSRTLWAGVLAVALLFSGRDRLPAAGLAVAVLPHTLRFTVPLLDPLFPPGAAALLLTLLSGTAPLLRAHRGRTRATPPSAA